MKRISFVIIMITTSAVLLAQTHMRIHHKGGRYNDIPIEQIDSITFVGGSDTLENEGGLVGSWLWGDAEAGYYELLTFNDDKTYTGYDNYFTYGFDTMSYGWYMQMGNMLTLQSNGFGYNRRYNWFVLGLTDNSLDVITKMGRYTYYKLQSEVLNLNISSGPLTYENGDYFIFADNVVTSVVNGCLIGKTKGTTYVQKYIAETSQIFTYKVIVE